EHENLMAWVRSGNTLLILAALDDTPEWAPANASRDFLEDLQIISGVRFRQENASTVGGPTLGRAPIGAGTAVELEAIDGHPLMEGVETLRGYSDAESALWGPIVPESASMLLLRLAAERTSGLDAGWERRYGNGHLLVVASG